LSVQLSPKANRLGACDEVQTRGAVAPLNVDQSPNTGRCGAAECRLNDKTRGAARSTAADTASKLAR
jgi:hypothetical protein